MKKRCLAIMDTAFGAYSEEHLQKYFAEVREHGLTEHGFPRLIANLGILIAHRYRRELLPFFIEAMDFCCESIPKTSHAGNDFSVKEVVFAILELQKSDIVSAEKLSYWSGLLAGIDPYTVYEAVASSPDQRLGNWAAYNAASEFMRHILCGVGNAEFLETQIATQLPYFDEKGMYRDPSEPMLYDLATRCQFAVLLHFGYDGRHREEIERLLDQSAVLTMQMQSVTGEIPFGGRSNQFLFNEAYLAAILFLESARYQRKGEGSLAGQLHRAAGLALQAIETHLAETPIRHVKNHWGQTDQMGCEGYAYFDKYMISLASFVYLAYLFEEDSVDEIACPAETGGYACTTSQYFHKLFVSCGGYSLEFDLNADAHYDANGLGRIHHRGTPGVLGLSTPFAKAPGYKIEGKNPRALSLCASVEVEGVRYYGADAPYQLVCTEESTERVMTRLCVEPADKIQLIEQYEVTENGVQITLSGSEKMGYEIPAFAFDGREQTTIVLSEDKKHLAVSYRGHLCQYTTDGHFEDTGETFCNRNGKYHAFRAVGNTLLHVFVQISAR